MVVITDDNDNNLGNNIKRIQIILLLDIFFVSFFFVYWDHSTLTVSFIVDCISIIAPGREDALLQNSYNLLVRK